MAMASPKNKKETAITEYEIGDIKVGDLVNLKTGGPEMIVMDISNPDLDGEGSIRCRYASHDGWIRTTYTYPFELYKTEDVLPAMARFNLAIDKALAAPDLRTAKAFDDSNKDTFLEEFLVEYNSYIQRFPFLLSMAIKGRNEVIRQRSGGGGGSLDKILRNAPIVRITRN